MCTQAEFQILKRFPLGTVVRQSRPSELLHGNSIQDIGHVMGFTRNLQDEVILEILWSTPDTCGNMGRIRPMHPSNVEII